MWEYAKSTSLTAVQMAIMRRITCWLATHYRSGQSTYSPTQTI